LERGGAAGGCILACEGAGAMLTEPTSLNRGEGLVTGAPGAVVGGVGASEGGGGEVVVDERE